MSEAVNREELATRLEQCIPRVTDKYLHETAALMADAVRVLRSAAGQEPVTNSPHYRHKKRGSIVREVARGFAQVAHHPIEEMTAVVIYQHVSDGKWWVRNAVEFDDGRFEPIALPVSPPAPVAWLYEVFIGEGAWSQKYSDTEILPAKWIRNIRPLYLSPAPSAGQTDARCDAVSEELIKQATAAADGIEYCQDSRSIRRRTAEIIRELIAALPANRESVGEERWAWLPIDHRSLKTGTYLVGHRGHQEILKFFGPEVDWAPGTQIGWRRLGMRGWERDEPAERFNATHCVLIQPPGEAK